MNKAIVIAVVFLSSIWGWAQVNMGEFATLGNECYSGKLYTNGLNWVNSGSPHNGFRVLCENPRKNLFSPVGMYFEHIFNGTLADEWRAWYAPHKSICNLNQLSPSSSQLIWNGEENTWGMDCLETFKMNGPALDMKFEVAINEENCAPLGWISFMWASYMDKVAIERNIHFYGIESGKWSEPNILGWANFGREEIPSVTPNDPSLYARVGSVRYLGSPRREIEEGVCNLNAGDSYFQFVRPFYYGFTDGDGDFTTTNDTMIYLMMFDRSEEIRLVAMNPRNLTTAPAWDWQFVIRNPQVGSTYKYNTRLLMTPISDFLSGTIDRTELTRCPPEEVNNWATSQWQSWVSSLEEIPNSRPYIIMVDRMVEETSTIFSWPKGKPFVAPEVIAADDHDGNITDRVVVDISLVCIEEVGLYPFTYTVEDSNGLSFTKTVTVTIRDCEPKINFGCQNPLLWPQGKEFVWPDITAFNETSNLSETVELVSNNLNISTIGNYQIVAKATSPEGVEGLATLTVAVVDSKPKIAFDCQNPLRWPKGLWFNIPNVRVWSDYIYDTGLGGTTRILSNEVVFSQVGSYKVVATATSCDGLTTEETLVVNIIDSQPRLTFDGPNPLLWRKGTTFVMPRVIAASDYYEDSDALNAAIKIISNNVNTNKAGDYQIVATTTNPLGLSVQSTLNVQVKSGFIYDLTMFFRKLFGS